MTFFDALGNGSLRLFFVVETNIQCLDEGIETAGEFLGSKVCEVAEVSSFFVGVIVVAHFVFVH